MKHERNFFVPRASEFGVIVTVTCGGGCNGTGTCGEGDAAFQCETCEGSGEVEVFDGETVEVVQ